MTRVFTTKYALSSGIEERDCELDSTGLAFDRSQGFADFYHGEGREWHRTFDAAVARAEAMRTAKLASLEKQKANLIARKFTAPKVFP